jgi:hypothetical protein
MAVLTAAAAKAERLHGRKLLPPGPQMLGMGAFGVVFPTRDPGWVCKVTIDGSEAFFARVQKRLAMYPKGTCRYLEPLRIFTPAGPAWLVWKETVEEPTYDQWYYRNKKPPADLEFELDELEWSCHVEKIRAGMKLREKWEKKRGVDGFPILHAMQQASIGVALRFAQLSEFDDRPAMFAIELDRAMPEANSHFNPRWQAGGWTYSDLSDRDPVLDAATSLLAFEWQLDRLRGHRMLGDVADAISAFFGEGILLADAQPDNIARTRSGWTLFDCGFALPLDRRWNAMWLDEEADPALWISSRRWEIFNQLAAWR